MIGNAKPRVAAYHHHRTQTHSTVVVARVTGGPKSETGRMVHVSLTTGQLRMLLAEREHMDKEAEAEASAMSDATSDGYCNAKSYYLGWPVFCSLPPHNEGRHESADFWWRTNSAANPKVRPDKCHTG